MTRKKQLEAIRATCIRANPDIELRCVYGHGPDSPRGVNVQDDTIRLADVLLAIPTLWVQPKTDVGNGTRFINSGMANSGISWKLRKDDLEEQSDECVAFLAGLFANQKQA